MIDITTNKDKPLCALKTDFVSQMYIIRIKIHEQNKKKKKIPSAQKPGACGNEHFLFSCYLSGL